MNKCSISNNMNSYQENTAQVLYEAANLYYDHQFSQKQIAERLGVSRPGVSRLLRKAREQGIVKIEIINPGRQGTTLELQLKERFELKSAIVVPNNDEDDRTIKSRLAIAAVKFLDQILSDGTILGVSWGTTLQAVSLAMSRKKYRNMSVVQLNGGISRAEYDTHAAEIVQRIGQRLSAIPYLLPLPAVVDRAELKRIIASDKNISRTLNLAEEATIAIFTIGSFSHQSALVKADYFEPEAVDNLLQEGAVGDICSRIISQNGDIASSELDSRTIGISLKSLQGKSWSIAIAGGLDKHPAIKAALSGKYFNVLITDDLVAKELLEN
ncbi:MAG: sugar-binding transcriptional regulator [Fidelibacterota bacterium]